MSCETKKVEFGKPPKDPSGEVFSETAQGCRNAVKRGTMTIEKALELSDYSYFIEMTTQALGYPVESGSAQRPEKLSLR